MQISFAALSCSNLAALSCSNLVALSCDNLVARCLLQPCGLCFFRMQIRFLTLSCSLFGETVAACLLQTAVACLLQTAASCT